jgi:hypothetical protein
MAQPPVALGLTLCDYVIVEDGTNKVSTIGILTKWVTKIVPFTPPTFFAHAALTDALGEVTPELSITRLETDEEIYNRQRRVAFADKLRELQVIFRVADLKLPAAGVYQFALLADGQWVAHRRARVLLSEGEP